jgi:hypothetical protein
MRQGSLRLMGTGPAFRLTAACLGCGMGLCGYDLDWIVARSIYLILLHLLGAHHLI